MAQTEKNIGAGEIARRAFQRAVDLEEGAERMAAALDQTALTSLEEAREFLSRNIERCTVLAGAAAKEEQIAYMATHLYQTAAQVLATLGQAQGVRVTLDPVKLRQYLKQQPS